MRRFLAGALLLSALGASADVEIANARFRLVLGDDAVPKSLVVTGTGEEMLAPARGQPLFSVTQERPFNNEVKLSYPNARTTYRANAVRRDGDRLVVGFEQTAYSAVFRLTEADGYVAFTLEGFADARTAYAGLKLDCPPVCAVRLMDLPVRRRAQFGSWLNVVWDDSCAVAVIAASVDELISGERRDDGVRLMADASSAVRTVGATALLVASETPRFLDCMDAAEVAFGMPRGVASRRSKEIRQSTLSTFVCPTNVEEVIAFAHQGGFRNVLLNYGHIVKEGPSWELCGNYDFRPDYPNGFADLRMVFGRLKAAGLTPGLHFLSTHIGMKSRYVTPVADPRLGLKRRYTLAAPLAADATELAVEEDPRLAPLFESLRVLKFGGELIRYTARTTQRPYRFTGLSRGAFGTRATAHAAGTIGGVLDVCEYGGAKNPGSCYLDPDTSLADEIAEKLARLCNCGAEFLYMDGAEGVKPPYGHYVARAQKLVWDKLAVAPKFAEGAAKSHFSWHMLSAANAYDQFLPHVFERCVARYPVEGAKEMAKSFTQVDFGWWGIVEPYEGVHGGTQPELWEWGLKLAVAYDAPVTVQCRGASELKALGVPLDELLAVSKRWLTAREKGFFTPEMKRRLRDTSVRHILRERPDGTYALVERPRDPPLPDPKAVAVTDMNPGVLLKVSPVEITDGVPCLFYAAKPGRHYFWGAADGAAEAQTVVETPTPGFVRFVPPGRRYVLKMSTAPTAVWREGEGWAFLSPERFWREVSPADARPPARAAARPSEADLARVRAVVDGTRFAHGASARKVVLFADATSGFGAEVCRFAAARAGLFSVDVETTAARLDDAEFLSGYDAAVLCGPLACGGAAEAAFLPPALAAFVARGKGLALLHGRAEAHGGSCACRTVRSRTGSLRYLNEAVGSPLLAPFRDEPVVLRRAGEACLLPEGRADEPDGDVLVSLDASDTETQAALDGARCRPGGRRAVSSVRRLGRGRVFRTTFGHDAAAFLDERLAHMLLGIQWTLGDLSDAVAAPIPRLADRLWMWGHEPEAWRALSEPLARLGLSPSNHCSQVEGCRLMGIRRDCIIRWQALPPLPVDEAWLEPFRGLAEVAWSATDSDASRTFREKIDVAIAMKGRLLNLTTVYLDDYFQSHMRPIEELKAAREKVHAAGLKLSVVMYADVEGFRAGDLASARLCDSVALWFWKQDSFDAMEAKVREARRFLGADVPLSLGLYLWSFGEAFGPVTESKMKVQLAVAERLLREGLVESLIFHPTLCADMSFPAIDLAKGWIRRQTGGD